MQNTNRIPTIAESINLAISKEQEMLDDLANRIEGLRNQHDKVLMTQEMSKRIQRIEELNAMLDGRNW